MKASSFQAQRWGLVALICLHSTLRQVNWGQVQDQPYS